ncbi:MAG: EAL domain-containing protein [Lachnospirales bacterium]
MFPRKFIKFNILLPILLVFIFAFDSLVYASETVHLDSERFFLYSNHEYLTVYEELLQKAVSLAPVDELELDVTNEMALQRARVDDLVYVSYPGLLALGEESPNIEKFNLEFISRTLGVNIEFKTCEDFGLPNTFESVQILLDSKIADFAGFYSYNTEKNRELESQYYATSKFSKQNVYKVSQENDKEIDLFTDKVIVEENITQVNNYFIANSNLSHSTNIEESLNMVKQGVVDYYLAESVIIPYITLNSDFFYTPVSNKNLSPDLKMIASNSQFENLINIIDQLYTGEVLEVFYDASENIIARNRFVLFYESFKGSKYDVIKYDKQIEVGVYESKGIAEKNADDQWQGFCIDYLNEITYITGLNFKIVDYTDKSMDTMLGDLSTGKLDVIFALPYELKDDYESYVEDSNTKLYFTSPYFSKKINILKDRDTTTLNAIEDISVVNIGYDVHNEVIIKDFVRNIYGNINETSLHKYQNSDLLFDALKNGEVRYTIGLPGEKVSLLRNNEDWVEYAFDYEFTDDINNYSFSFVLSQNNGDAKEVYNLLNKVINTIHEKEDSLWFLESANFNEIVSISDLNSFLVNIIFFILLFAIIVTIVVYIRTSRTNKSIYEQIKVDKISELGNRFAFFENVSLKDKAYYCIIISVGNKHNFFEEVGKWNITPLLRSIGSRITSMSTDVVFDTYRLSGEEFILLVDDAEISAIKKFLALLIASIRMPYQIGDNTLDITFNVGVCESKYAKSDVKKMLLYTKNMVNKHIENKSLEYCMFTDEDKKEIESFELIEELINGDLSKCIIPFFQPIIDHKTRKIIGVEVLARLIANGVVFSAEKFISIAERNDKIDAIDMLILEETVRYRESLLERKLIEKDFYFTVNVSFTTVKRLEKASLLRLKYMNNALTLSFLRMEIKEQYLNTIEASNFFRLLDEENIGIDVDDFSIGHSSLVVVIERNFSSIKIDKSLLLSGLDDTNKLLYKSLVSMLKTIDQKVIALGVEKEEHHGFVESLDIDAKEGHYYSVPLSASDLVKYLSENELLFLIGKE